MGDDRSEQAAPQLHVLIARQRGLARALEKFPNVVIAAGERGSKSFAVVPGGPLTEPADIFDPLLGAGGE
jgi:hypothetical protein